jgi:hypothetical protein
MSRELCTMKLFDEIINFFENFLTFMGAIQPQIKLAELYFVLSWQYQIVTLITNSSVREIR